MPVPRTNLFKGDRVRLTPEYISSLRIRNKHVPVNRYAKRVGCIVSDTLDPRFEVVIVHWDGCLKPELRSDRGYSPFDLMLVEDETI